MTVKITLRMNAEDAKRLVQAFEDGKLADLGILDMQAAETETPDDVQKKWVNAEAIRRDLPEKDDTESPRR